MVLPRTRLWSTCGRLGSLRDVHPNDQLIALGQPTELGQWVAGLVMITGPEAPAWRGLRGTVVAVDAKDQILPSQIRQDIVLGGLTLDSHDAVCYNGAIMQCVMTAWKFRGRLAKSQNTGG